MNMRGGHQRLSQRDEAQAASVLASRSRNLSISTIRSGLREKRISSTVIFWSKWRPLSFKSAENLFAAQRQYSPNKSPLPSLTDICCWGRWKYNLGRWTLQSQGQS